MGEENKLTKPVEVTEINYKNKFFDYKTKYNLGLSKHIIPANLSSKIYKKGYANPKNSLSTFLWNKKKKGSIGLTSIISINNRENAVMISHTKPLRVMSISQPIITQFISIIKP